MFIHGDADRIVPYDNWTWQEHNFSIDGAASLARYYQENGLPYVLVTGVGGTHDYGGYAFARDQSLIDLFITKVVKSPEPKQITIVETPLPADNH